MGAAAPANDQPEKDCPIVSVRPLATMPALPSLGLAQALYQDSRRVVDLPERSRLISMSRGVYPSPNKCSSQNRPGAIPRLPQCRRATRDATHRASASELLRAPDDPRETKPGSASHEASRSENARTIHHANDPEARSGGYGGRPSILGFRAFRVPLAPLCNPPASPAGRYRRAAAKRVPDNSRLRPNP